MRLRDILKAEEFSFKGESTIYIACAVYTNSINIRSKQTGILTRLTKECMDREIQKL